MLVRLLKLMWRLVLVLGSAIVLRGKLLGARCGWGAVRGQPGCLTAWWRRRVGMLSPRRLRVGRHVELLRDRRLWAGRRRLREPWCGLVRRVHMTRGFTGWRDETRRFAGRHRRTCGLTDGRKLTCGLRGEL
ncbi:MAG: hypothetical protein ACRDT1_13775, partial [Micromonosporaceae bacterium]